MISSLANTLRWTLSLASKFARVVPFATLFIIALTLVSQISMLVASLMPLKVVILLGSEQIPSYFPDFLAGLGHHALIGLLSLITVAFFILHLVSEKLIAWGIENATSRLLKMSQKMSLFERQEQIAQNAYLRFSRALASAVFVILAFIGLSFFYPAMVIVQLGYVCLVVIILWSLDRLNKSFKERLETKPGPILGLMAVIGFFVAFVFLVIDFMFLNPPVPLIAIISLLLTRQVMNRLASVATDFFHLQQERIKLDALFFHGKVFMPQVMEEAKGIWSLLQIESRNKWGARVLAEFSLNPEGKEVIYRWQQVGVIHVGALQASVGSDDYLLKVYEVNRTSQAHHELVLLSENLKNLPAIKFIGATELGKLNCLVYHMPKGKKPDQSEYRTSLWRFRFDLLSTEVPSSFVTHYQRSKPLLWQRLMALPLERLQMAAEEDDGYHQLKEFFSYLPRINQILNALPLSIVNPNTALDSLWLQSDERCVGLQWGLWAIEPVGAGWPEKEADFKKLEEFWPDIVKQRGDLREVSLTDVKLASLMFAVERDFNRQYFIQVLDLLPRIIGCIEAVKKEGESEK